MIRVTLIMLFAAACLAGCRRETVQPGAPHPRVVSFSPALTQMMFDMGLGEHIVGVTTQCELPPGQERKRLGDVISGNVTEAILAVDPEIVLIQMKPQQFATLHRVAPEVNIEHFSIETLDDIPTAMQRIGQLTGKPEIGAKHADDFRTRLDRVRKLATTQDSPAVLFVLGYRNPSTGGAGTFIDQMITAAGGRNAAAQLRGWCELGLERIIAAHPDVLVVWMQDPQDAQAARDYFGSIEGLRNTRISVVSEPGWTIPTGRIIQHVEMLQAIIHPQLAETRPAHD